MILKSDSSRLDGRETMSNKTTIKTTIHISSSPLKMLL